MCPLKSSGDAHLPRKVVPIARNTLLLNDNLRSCTVAQHTWHTAAMGRSLQPCACTPGTSTSLNDL
eukprot:CAMPEP_0172737546 /NCGR_PEP_ID=MMETSP1074-20121228/117913_1 /TAXON_ID=2916 /ORGANISM="Ceratium fusus, Strain PA161109" /LENGTH=65 /DNA_ID=CAMNT_0013566959 /DNA_START=33 /DNA_END=226 /DNA_ORIENTATION=-